jgi:hypothetical protein
MNITLESVQFRIPGELNGAFNLSVRGTSAEPRRIITGPEWLNGTRQPAALAGNASCHFIEVVLLSSDRGLVDATLQATAVNGHLLGDIGPVEIVFQNGRWAGRIELAAAHIDAVGKHEIQWLWLVTAGDTSAVFDSTHTIYAVLTVPGPPWESTGNDPSSAPWEEALEAACTWACGATAGPSIFTRIADFHYPSGRFKYGAHTYVEEGIFKMRRFLDHLSQQEIQDVDCGDCASIVAIFGALLGATGLDVELETGMFAYILAQTNVFVGGDEGPGNGFVFHEVVSDISAENAADVWDFCLGRKVGSQAQPFTASRFRNSAAPDTAYPALSCNRSAAGHLEFAGFHPRAVKDTARILDLEKPVDPARLPVDGWTGRFRECKGVAFENFVPGRIRDVAPVETYRYEKQPKPWLVENLYRLGGGFLQVSIFTSDSRQDAHVALLHLLADRRANPALTLSREPIGDVLFYDEPKLSDLLLFGRGNLAIRLQRSHGSGVPLLETAQLVDSMLMAGLKETRQVAANANTIVREILSVNTPRAGRCIRHSCETDEIGFSRPSGTVARLL